MAFRVEILYQYSKFCTLVFFLWITYDAFSLTDYVEKNSGMMNDNLKMILKEAVVA
jgi:hypothetical protein